VLRGYNAGTGNINRWKNNYRARYGKEPTLDRFAESIPYKETKDYIRLVLSGYMIYQYLGAGGK
jgi:soluble lytic murein transglycosylase